MVEIYFESAIEAGYTGNELLKVVTKECSKHEKVHLRQVTKQYQHFIDNSK
jgi:hypothetical protein